jgi:hypothetical protein
MRCCFIEWCEGEGLTAAADGSPYFAPVTHFVSHAWHASFPQLVATLELYAAGDGAGGPGTGSGVPAGEAAWFLDVFSINQHVPPWREDPPISHGQVLKPAIVDCSRTVLVLQPWEKPTSKNVNGETKTYTDVSSSFQDQCSEMVCVRRYEAHVDFQKLDFQNEDASTNLGKLISKLLQKDDSPFSKANVIPKIFSNIENARLESLIQIHKLRQAPPAAGANRAVLIKHLDAARESLETESYSYNTEDNTVTLNPDIVVEVEAPTNEEEVAATNQEAEIANAANEKAKADAVERIARNRHSVISVLFQTSPISYNNMIKD